MLNNFFLLIWCFFKDIKKIHLKPKELEPIESGFMNPDEPFHKINLYTTSSIHNLCSANSIIYHINKIYYKIFTLHIK